MKCYLYRDANDPYMYSIFNEAKNTEYARIHSDSIIALLDFNDAVMTLVKPGEYRAIDIEVSWWLE